MFIYPADFRGFAQSVCKEAGHHQYLRTMAKTTLYLYLYPKGGIFALIYNETRQSKQCGLSIYIFDNSKSKSMVRLVRSENMALSGLVFARKIARMILIQNVLGLMGP